MIAGINYTEEQLRQRSYWIELIQAERLAFEQRVAPYYVALSRITGSPFYIMEAPNALVPERRESQDEKGDDSEGAAPVGERR